MPSQDMEAVAILEKTSIGVVSTNDLNYYELVSKINRSLKNYGWKIITKFSSEDHGWWESLFKKNIFEASRNTGGGVRKLTTSNNYLLLNEIKNAYCIGLIYVKEEGIILVIPDSGGKGLYYY
jgi:hypothetical protein